MPAMADDDAVDPELVDLEVLGGWMDGQGLPAGPFENVRLLSGGTQNVLMYFERGGRAHVLRRPPKHLRKASNRVLEREATMLAALADTDVPHPRLHVACTDTDVMGVVFYLMEPVDGFNATVSLPDLYKNDEQVQRGIGLSAIDALARLGRVDYQQVGLGDFGKPEGFLQRQVPRWMKELDGYSELDGYDGPQIPQLADVAAWLREKCPAQFTPGIMHGDYHLANLMYRHDRGEIAAIVDWEMCTIGDPLLDLGWMLATWPEPGAPPVGPAASLARLPGLPKPAELVEHYGERTDRDLTHLDWYHVMACFKLGIILEGTHARACAGKAAKGTGDLLHMITLGLFAKAAKLIG